VVIVPSTHLHANLPGKSEHFDNQDTLSCSQGVINTQVSLHIIICLATVGKSDACKSYFLQSRLSIKMICFTLHETICMVAYLIQHNYANFKSFCDQF